MPKLSISRAWDETRAVLARDGRLLTTVALALFVLPGTIGSLVTPPAPPGAFPEAGLWMIPALAMVLISLVGQLAVIRLALGPPLTVGESIRHGARRAPAYIAASVIWLAPFLLAFWQIIRNLEPNRPAPMAGLLLLVLTFVCLFFFIRLIFSSTVASAENRGPLAILQRSWELTRGQWWRLFAFFILFAIAVIVVTLAVSVVVGVIVGLASGGQIEPLSIGALVLALVTQLAMAVLTIILLTMLARLYLQRAGRDGAADGEAEVSVPSSGT